MSEFRLVKTCNACPEQYNVFVDGSDERIGHLRLRHGHFTADYQGRQVYHGTPNGDGSFEENERDHFLNAACHAIRRAMEGEHGPQLPKIFTIEDQS